MNRLPIAAFSALVVATVAAFFIAQHLKVTDPLIQGAPSPVPATFDPLYGFSGRGAPEPRACWSPRHTVQVGKRTQTVRAAPLNYRQTYTTFYLQHQRDHAAVYIVDTTGDVVATLASNYDFAHTYQRNPPSAFAWNGREGAHVAPDGVYFYQVVLSSQGRPLTIGKPIRIVTKLPHPVVRTVAGVDSGGRASDGSALISPVPKDSTASTGTVPVAARIHYVAGTDPAAGSPKSVEVEIYRTDLPGGPRQVFAFAAPPRRATVVWNGRIRGVPAPPGTYLVGLESIDAACNVGDFPAEEPPVPGTTAHTGVTVTYLNAQVPLTPVPAGTKATVLVDARQNPYRWALRVAGTEQVVARGSASGYHLLVRLPTTGPGLYQLAIRNEAGAPVRARTVVPLVASAAPAATAHSVLVVLPTLTWQGLNPVDDTGDGLPSTLTAGGPVALDRPLENGLPADFGNEASLLSVLQHAGFHYDVSTDLGLLADPSVLKRYHGVVLAGPERWLPGALRSALQRFVMVGGHVLSIGANSLNGSVTISGDTARDPLAGAHTDIFGARLGALILHNRFPVLRFAADPLKLFTGSSADFTGIGAFQAITPPPGPASRAGISSQQSAIVGFPLGRGAVVEIGFDNFGGLIAHDRDLRSVLARAWRLLGS